MLIVRELRKKKEKTNQNLHYIKIFYFQILK